MDLEGGVAIVTGSSSGVGAACARQLAEKGCNVVVNYAHNEEGAATTQKTCEELGVETVIVKADVADDDGCRALADAAENKWGRIDALVNNAGTTKFCAHDDLEGLSKQDFLDIYAVNAIGAYQMVRAVAPAMRQRGMGRIVNISSRSALGKALRTNYSASKAALIGLTRTWALELAADGITVNCICPGPIATELYKQANPADDPRTIASLATIPAGRIGTPEDIAQAAVLEALKQLESQGDGCFLVREFAPDGR